MKLGNFEIWVSNQELPDITQKWAHNDVYIAFGLLTSGQDYKETNQYIFHGYPEKRVTDLFLSFFSLITWKWWIPISSLSCSSLSVNFLRSPVSHEAPSHFSAAPQALMALVTAMRPGARGPPRRSRKRKRCRARCHSLKRIKKVGTYFATVVKTMEVTTMPRLPIDK